jgi:hypothetical protein
MEVLAMSESLHETLGRLRLAIEALESAGEWGGSWDNQRRLKHTFRVWREVAEKIDGKRVVAIDPTWQG